MQAAWKAYSDAQEKRRRVMDTVRGAREEVELLKKALGLSAHSASGEGGAGVGAHRALHERARLREERDTLLQKLDEGVLSLADERAALRRVRELKVVLGTKEDVWTRYEAAWTRVEDGEKELADLRRAMEDSEGGGKGPEAVAARAAAKRRKAEVQAELKLINEELPALFKHLEGYERGIRRADLRRAAVAFVARMESALRARRTDPESPARPFLPQQTQHATSRRRHGRRTTERRSGVSDTEAWVLKSAALDVPRTWDELESTLDRLRALKWVDA